MGDFHKEKQSPGFIRKSNLPNSNESHEFIECKRARNLLDLRMYVTWHLPIWIDKSTTHTKLGCCSITQKFPFEKTYNWGTNCIKRENELNDHIQIISFSEPSETTCRVKFTLLTTYRTNGIKTESEFFDIITLKKLHV